MAIDPKKMESWLNRDAKPEKLPVVDPKKSAAGAEAEEQPEPEKEKEAEGTLEQEFPTLFPLLEAHGHLIDEAISTLDTELLLDEASDWDEENLELLDESVAELPPELQKSLKDEASDLSWSKAEEIAEALYAGDHVSDVESTAAFLFWAAQHV